MPTYGKEPAHFGPDPHQTGGPEGTHATIHSRSIGKTVAAVYLGDDYQRISKDDDLELAAADPDGMFRGEYLAFEFDDGTSLVLLAAGNAFYEHGEGAKMLAAAKAAAAARKRT